jgi:hypothetical protein
VCRVCYPFHFHSQNKTENKHQNGRGSPAQGNKVRTALQTHKANSTAKHRTQAFPTLSPP